MDVDMSAIGYSFAGSVDEGKVQASNQVLWDAHLNRAGLAQHWNYKKSLQNNSWHCKTISKYQYQGGGEGLYQLLVGERKGNHMLHL